MSRHLFFFSLLIVSLSAAPPKKAVQKKAGAPADFNTAVPGDPLPGMPDVLNPADLYSADRALTAEQKKYLSRVYVPNSGSDTVDVIDPTTFKVVDHFAVGHQPQHVVPSWDGKTLWVLNDLGDSLTKVDPMTGKKGDTLPVIDPYNMYYTPDGKYAIVVAEAKKRLDFRDPVTMKLIESLAVPCSGVDHVDYSASGRYFLASCEFSGKVLKVDVAQKKLACGHFDAEPGDDPWTEVHQSPEHENGNASGCENFAGREGILRRGYGVRRGASGGWRNDEKDRVPGYRQRRSRTLSEPGFEGALCFKP